MPPSTTTTTDLRHRTNLSLTRLRDRDTSLLAVTELKSIVVHALNTHDELSTFLSCLLDSAEVAEEQTRVKRESVRLMTFLCNAHGERLSCHDVSNMVSVVVKLVRGSDSRLRLACVDCVSSMASKITIPPFSTFVNPLIDAVLHEQDHNAQIGSSLCLAAAIDAVHDPEPTQLQKLLPKLLKLVTKDCFKAKTALLSLIGTIASAGGTARNCNVLSGLVSCLLEFLSSKDWAARKAAGEALSRLAVVEKGNLMEFRGECLACLENKRFDKVKIVRDTLNSTLKQWKEVPEIVSPQLQCRSSPKDDGVVTRSPPLSRSSSNEKFGSTQLKKSYSTSRPPSSDNLFTNTRRTPKYCDKKLNAPPYSKQDHKDIEVVCADDLKNKGVGFREKTTNEKKSVLNLETRRALYRKKFDDKVNKSGSRVVPFYDDDKRDVDVNEKEAEDLNVIRKQLLQIEKQQSNLLELLQRFMGNSRSGMNQLENRVNGLEKSLDEISKKMEDPNTNAAENSCCSLPGAEFLRPKLWKRSETEYSSSSFALSQRNHSLSDTRANTKMQQTDSPLQSDRVNMQEGMHFMSSTRVGG